MKRYKKSPRGHFPGGMVKKPLTATFVMSPRLELGLVPVTLSLGTLSWPHRTEPGQPHLPCPQGLWDCLPGPRYWSVVSGRSTASWAEDFILSYSLENTK